MVFNSAVFIFFFCAVFVLYWSVSGFSSGAKIQNRFLLIASYVFYGYWDWIFLGLIAVSTVVDYFAARGIERSQKPGVRKALLALSACTNLGLLGTFKYFDFFAGSLVDLVRVFDPGAFPDGGESLFLRVVLPVGISFYTFQTMSYTIDVYRGIFKAERNFLDFALFVSFFPQLVAGPIERAGTLLPQLKERRVFSMENMQKGAWLILLGFFMKVYVADSLGPLVDQVYLPGAAAYTREPSLAAGHGGFQVFAASLGFAFQIYCDFAGYSNIALGTALMLGVRLTVNFDAPELSQNPVELWRRWHITLNRWVTDYVYISLGGSRVGAFSKLRNIFIAFTLMGVWHGANWTFVIWGAYQGLWMVLYGLSAPLMPKLREDANPVLKNIVRALKMAGVFVVFGVSAVLFRAYDIEHTGMLLGSLLDFPWNMTDSIKAVPAAGRYAMQLFNKIILLLILDIASYKYNDLFWVFKRPLWVRVPVYTAMFFAVAILGFFGRDVIYFAF